MTAELTCDRCGSFVPTREPFAGQQLCAECVGRELQQLKLYSYTAMLLSGILLNPTISLAMRTINARRLHDPAARGWLAGTFICGLCFLGYMALPFDVPAAVGLGAGAGVTLACIQSFKKPWEQLLARGVKKANPFGPVAIGLGVIVVAAVTITLLSGDAVE